MSELAPILKNRFFDLSGKPLASGKLYIYQAGTTIPLATFCDQQGVNANKNPVILDASGEAKIWISASAYKFVLKDANDLTQWSVDNVSVINPASVTTNLFADAGISTANFADLGVTTAKIPDGSATTAKFHNQSLANTKIPSQISVNRTMTGILLPKFTWSVTPTRIVPGSQPAGAALACAWSPDGRFLTFAHITTPFMTTYERVGASFLKIDNPTSLPGGNAVSAAWSPNGEFLAFGPSVGLNIFQRAGITLTKLTDPTTVPLTTGGMVWTVDGRYLLAVDSSAPYIHIYERAGTALNYLLGVLESPAPTAQGIALSHDGQLLAVTSTTTPYLTIYQNGTGLFGKLSAPTVIPTLACNKSVSFSPDGKFLVMGHNTTPFMTMYSISGTTFTKLASPAVLPLNNVQAFSWSPDSKYLIVGCFTTSPFMTVYQVSGTTFTAVAAPISFTTGNMGGLSFSPDGQFLAAAQTGATRATIYQTDQTLALNGIFSAGDILNV